MSDLPERISVREVGPRDGLQNEDPVPTEAKIELIDRLSATGVQRIEAVSFVRPGGDPADGRRRRGLAPGSQRAPSVRYSALVPNLRGARRALDRGLTEIEAVVSASDTHNRKNVNRVDRGVTGRHRGGHRRGASARRHLPGDRVDRVGLPVRGRRAGGAGGPGGIDGRWPTARTAISFGDTTGMATPRRVRELVGAFRSAHPDVAAQPAFPQHPRHRPGQRAHRARARGVGLRRLGGRARRLPVRAGRHRQHRHRGTRAHGRGHGRGDRDRPGRR